MFGETGNDTFLGGDGVDTMDGGADVDTVTYAQSTSGVKVSLATGNGSGGQAEGDTLISIENLTGSQHRDFLFGSDGQQHDQRRPGQRPYLGRGRQRCCHRRRWQ